jgi:hypothetical protein
MSYDTYELMLPARAYAASAADYAMTEAIATAFRQSAELLRAAAMMPS